MARLARIVVRPAVSTAMLTPAEEPGGMTWQEVKDFLDHIRATCMDERQMWKERARNAERDLKRCQDALMRLELDRLEETTP
jgi:hypothetical protein